MTDPLKHGLLGWPGFVAWSQGVSYALDAWQRGILTLDVMRQRGNQYHEHMAKQAPNVLSFGSEVVLDGRQFERPVNYGLLRITPPAGVEVDPLKRPFIVVDPRAGHGPGIGGFKADSEIGVALRAGHPCYFIGFLPYPVPGQTVEDVVVAETRFVEHVCRQHDDADGKPVVIGNCQAGWQIMMAAAIRPEVFGPILIAGAPLSYWAGWSGRNPMRYSGGLLGGSWMTALAGDLGHGLFDGAYLVENFEGLDPANTWWTKQYNLYSRIDTEGPRYLGFEKWWGSHVLLNAAEMQYIVDNLFVGNRLSTAELTMSDGTRIDLRNIRSPIIVFCSRGDNITPPPQALGWITDLYGSVDDIRATGQTIVYAVHDSIGHLGIFVSAAVARKEHEQFATNIDLIDVLPPGLYEAEIRNTDPEMPRADLVTGDHISRFAARDLDDVRAIIAEDPEDERRFATVAQVSRANLGLYRTFLQPAVLAWSNEATAEWLRRMHPLRISFEMFSDHNPFLRVVAQVAEQVRENRQPVGPDNPFLQIQGRISRQIVEALDHYRDVRDGMAEAVFKQTYGNPLLQALMGLSADDSTPRPKPGQDPGHRHFVERRATELRTRLAEGGLREAALRAYIYIGLAERVADERSFSLLKRIRSNAGENLSLEDLKERLREQFFMVLLDPEAALAALPHLLDGADAQVIRATSRRMHQVAVAGGPLTEAAAARLQAVEEIFAAAARRAEAGSPARAAQEAAAEVAATAPDPETDSPAPARPRRRAAR
ncbi:DUF3141 domain-containing protein [Roseomonas sp. OT10]|uniref:DUF3141 domain-containing protein n=1 Tax=Roseomonas cutis TaxID=2897332 RepID=UPI001E3CA2A3|nr:DUF3141 domain-containing protein [Roseomonas sp. OT10]UFN48206.1 DUF3141 domain-containing protein [Roseomonas sp. OT10]